MVDRDDDASASHWSEVRRDPQLVGTTGGLYCRTVAATPGAELLDISQSAERYETPIERSLMDDESNHFKGGQW